MIVRRQTIRFSPDRTPMPRKVKIGFEGDNMVERLEFVLPDIAESQTGYLMIDGDEANIVKMKQDADSGRGYADLSASAIGAEGMTECYVRVEGTGGTVWQSGILQLVVGDVPDVEMEIAREYPTAVSQMLADMAEHDAAMEEQQAEMEETVAAAEAAGQAAAQSETRSVKAAELAGQHRDAAERAASAASADAVAALQSKEEAQQAMADARTAQQGAEDAAEIAQASKDAAESAATRAETANEAVQRAAAEAEDDAQAAETAKATAETSAAAAQAAEQSAQNAAKSANASSGQAATDASAARRYQSDAYESRMQANSSAAKASASEQNAAAAAERAEAAAERAEAASQLDDDVVAKDRVWSSKATVDRLCPAFDLSGQIASCYPVEGYPMAVTSGIGVAQAGSGEPSPDNIRPITGHTGARLTRCGKNLLANSAASATKGGMTYTCNADGSITCTGTSTATQTFAISTDVLPAGSYILSGCPAGGALSGTGTYRLQIDAAMPDGTTVYAGDIGAGAAFTLGDKPVSMTMFIVITREGTHNNLVFRPMVRRASDPSPEYEPYRGEAYEAEWEAAIGGGRFDWATGELTTEWEYLALDGTESWDIYTETDDASRRYHFIVVGTKDTYVNGENGGVICSHWLQKLILASTDNIGVHLHNSAYNEDRLLFRPDMAVYDTADKWKEYLREQAAAGTPVTVVLQRTTPTITQLEAREIVALDGENCLYSTTGSTTVKGRADPGTIIGDMESRLAALEAAVMNNA